MMVPSSSPGTGPPSDPRSIGGASTEFSAPVERDSTAGTERFDSAGSSDDATLRGASRSTASGVATRASLPVVGTLVQDADVEGTVADRDVQGLGTAAGVPHPGGGRLTRWDADQEQASHACGRDDGPNPVHAHTRLLTRRERSRQLGQVCGNPSASTMARRDPSVRAFLTSHRPGVAGRFGRSLPLRTAPRAARPAPGRGPSGVRRADRCPGATVARRADRRPATPGSARGSSRCGGASRRARVGPGRGRRSRRRARTSRRGASRCARGAPPDQGRRRPGTPRDPSRWSQPRLAPARSAVSRSISSQHDWPTSPSHRSPVARRTSGGTGCARRAPRSPDANRRDRRTGCPAAPRTARRPPGVGSMRRILPSTVDPSCALSRGSPSPPPSPMPR